MSVDGRAPVGGEITYADCGRVAKTLGSLWFVYTVCIGGTCGGPSRRHGTGAAWRWVYGRAVTVCPRRGGGRPRRGRARAGRPSRARRAAARHGSRRAHGVPGGVARTAGREAMQHEGEGGAGARGPLCGLCRVFRRGPRARRCGGQGVGQRPLDGVLRAARRAAAPGGGERPSSACSSSGRAPWTGA